MAVKVPIYEGSFPYIFISYAHKDRDSVLSVLDVLCGRGYRVWYDDGIAPGSEWPEYIAAHLDRAEAVIAFISDNSVASSNCRREITFALARNKPFVSVFLEKTELPLGLELQISAQQSVLRHNYETEEAFFDKLCSTPAFEPCREQAEVVVIEPVPATVAGPKPAAAIETKTAPANKPEPAAAIGTIPAIGAEEVWDITPEPAATPEPPVIPKQAGTSKTAPAGKDIDVSPAIPDKPVKKAKKKNPILFAVIAAVVVVIGIAAFIASSGGSGFGSSNNSVYLDYSDENITRQTIAEINKARNVSSLKFSNCSFDEGVLAELAPRFREDSSPTIDFRDCTGVDDLSFLSKYEKVSIFYCRNCGLTDSVAADFSEVVFNYLDLSGNPELTHLTLNSQRLYGLDLSGTKVENLDFLASAEELDELNLQNTNVSDLSPIASLEGIRSLNLSGSKVNSFATELSCLGLTELDLNGCGLTSSEGLGDYVALKKLDLGNNSLTDVSFIAKIAPNLELLDLSGNNITGADLAFLENAENMVQLGLDSIDLSECQLSYLEKMQNLKVLLARNCNLSDISGLQNCTKLLYIILGFNDIKDVTPLASLEESSYSNRILDLTKNQVESVAPLNAYFNMILLTGNPISDGKTGSAFRMRMCMMDYYDGLEKSTPLGDSNAELYISGCPRDKQLEITNLSYKAVFCTRAEQLEKINSEYPGLGYYDYEELYLAE